MKLKTLAILLITCATSYCFAEGTKKELKFAKGASSASVAGSVVRGDVDEYQIGAKAGQEMTVSVTALEDNAAFVIYLPNSKKTLPRAGEGNDAQKWTGKLPKTGTYTIAVAGTRGNASYNLNVAIK
ncbi:MAG: hypothetical protein ACJ763_10535 [Bdellovibrionia bacterium]